MTHLIEDLFARSQSLGWIGAALAALAGLAFIVVIGRELFGLLRLARIEKLHARGRGQAAARLRRWRLERSEAVEWSALVGVSRLA